MFALNEILVFGPGRRQEALDRLSWIHGLMAPNPGFKHAIVAKYLGDGARHTIMRFWDDAEAYQRFRETPDGNYGRNRPEGLYNNERVVSPLESYMVEDGTSQGDFLVKVQRQVTESAWDAFVAAQQILTPALKAHGLVFARNFRGKDDPTQSITVARFQNREDVEQITESPEYSKMIASMPEGVTPIRTEFFEVVTDVGPKR